MITGYNKRLQDVPGKDCVENGKILETVRGSECQDTVGVGITFFFCL